MNEYLLFRLKFYPKLNFWKAFFGPLFLLVALFSLPFSSGLAQQNSNLKTLWIKASADTLQIDSLYIIPETLALYPEPKNYYYEPISGLFFWPNDGQNDSVLAVYRTLEIKGSVTLNKKDLALINPYIGFDEQPLFYDYKSTGQSDELIDVAGLQKTGNIARGVVTGNNRNLSVNSNLNLQLSGNITPDIEILASITDNNIPIQPDGNTQQLQDFDRIFIQLFNDRFTLVAGDYELASTDSYFLKYMKKNLGLSFKTRTAIGPDRSFEFESAVAMSKGKFARNVIIGQESLQGPYRLVGSEGESFIIVLSGTERVYLDGQLLNRGADNDYTIDYNTAEIIFTPQVLMTKDKRITVEFQYSDKNFFRTMFQAGGNYSFKKGHIYTHFYSEQDAKNQEQQQVLSDEERNLLASIGNDLDQAVVPSIDSTGYDESRVMYALIDSLGYDSVFIVSTQPDVAVYQLRFSDVGAGKGNYRQGPFIANGRTFEWIAPDTINGTLVLNGQFEPVRKLITPKTHQMLVAGFDLLPGGQFEVNGEAAFTRLDPNTFSSIDNNQNTSMAFKTEVSKTIDLVRSQRLKVFGGYEFIQKRFKPIERFRSVEFSRDWNLTEINDSLKQGEFKGGFEIGKTNLYQIIYTYKNLSIKDFYAGNKHLLQTQLSTGSWKASYNGSFLTTDKEGFSTQFYRHKADLSYTLKPLIIGASDELEDNQQFNANADLDSLYKFYDWRIYLKSTLDRVNSWRIYGGKRLDYRAPLGKVLKESDATNLGAEYHFLNSLAHRFKLTLNYRQVTLSDSAVTSTTEPEESVTGRVDYGLRAAKGAINWTVFYQFGSGLDQQREFFYQEVNQGLGIYEWIDLNSDGVKDLNEFFVSSNPALANYIRVFTPNNNFVRVVNAQFSQNLALTPSTVWNNEVGFKKVVSKFSTQTLYSINKTTASDQADEAFNPFFNPLLDTALQSYTNTFRNTIFFNRAFTRFSAEYTFNDNRVKNLLLNGFQSTGIRSHLVVLRWNITKVYAILLGGTTGFEFSASDFIDSGNYKILFNKAEPEFRIQPNRYFRIALKTSISLKNNEDSEIDQNATIYSIGFESRFNSPEKGSFFADVKVSGIEYSGPDNTPSQVKMLDALRPGLNITWSANWQYNLNKFLQLTLNYNGRKSESVDAIHVGGVQVRAFF